MSFVSGTIGAIEAGEAADTQAEGAVNAAKISADAQLRMYEEGRADTAPWRKSGEEALNTLVEKVKAGPGEYTKSPGYEFRLGEGNKAIQNSAAARGGVLSGSTVKGLERYNQDYATGDYQNFLANYYNSLTPLQSLAQVGQTTASQNAVTGSQVGANIGNTIANGMNTAASAQAGGAINQANAITGASNNAVNNYMMWKYLNKAPDPNSIYASGYDAAVAGALANTAAEGYVGIVS